MMNSIIHLFLSVLVPVAMTLLASLTIPSKLQAEIYQYISQDGVIHFTNVPTDPRYRRMTLVETIKKPLSHNDLHETILSEARQHQLDPALVKAVIKVESDFNPQAISVAGAMGLMQLMPATVATLNVQDPFNPQENIAGGVKYLKRLLDRFDGDLTLALAAYHAGENRVERYGQIPPIEQTRRYIRKVMAAYQAYRRNAHKEDTGQESIYRVITRRGQVIYTNVPFLYQNAGVLYGTDLK